MTYSVFKKLTFSDLIFPYLFLEAMFLYLVDKEVFFYFLQTKIDNTTIVFGLLQINFYISSHFYVGIYKYFLSFSAHFPNI